MLTFLKNQRASTIIESIVAIGLISFFISIFGVSYVATSFNQHLKLKNLAFNLVAEELEAIRNAPYDQLSNRTNNDFIEVIYNVGSWSVQTNATAPSLPNTYVLTIPQGTPSGITGLATLPGFEYANFSYESEIFVKSDSPANWQAGLFARYQDVNNNYFVYFTSTNIYLKKVVNGVETTLDSKAKTFLTDTWHDLKLEVADDVFIVYVNDISELTATDTDNSFTEGRLALLGTNSVHAFFDDVSVITASTTTWNFDSETVNSMPASWQRFGINDLSQGTAKLTIEEPETGHSDLKKIIVRVEWLEKGNTRNVEAITLITK